jgi:hypothetical protein
MMPITAQIPVFSSRMPGKSMHGCSGRKNRVRDQRFHFPVVPDDRKMLAHLRAGPGCCPPRFATAGNPTKSSIAMQSESGPDGQVSD